SDWFRPGYNETLVFGPAFDAIGNPVATLAQDPNARYCVDLRFSPLTATNTGNGVLRVEVRVAWLRSDGVVSNSVTPPAHACAIGATEMEGADERQYFHFVFLSGAVRQVVGL